MRTHQIPAVTCALLMLAACARAPAGPALPLPTEVVEYVIPWPDAFPSDVAVDDAGRVWFTDRLTHVIGRLDPATGEFTRFETPTAKSAPYGFVRGPDGALWFAESRLGRLGRLDPATGAITEHALEGVRDGPNLLAVAGGRIWFTMRDVGEYGSYDPATGRTAVFAAPARMRPYGIASDGIARVWISGGRELFEIDVHTDSVRLRDLTRPDSAMMRRMEQYPDSVRARLLANRQPRTGPAPRRMSARGASVWMTDFAGGGVAVLDAHTGAVREFASVDRQAAPYGILAAESGLIWYNEKNNDVIVVLDPRTGERARYRLGTPGAAVRHIAEDAARHRIWLPLSDRGRIGLITTPPKR